MTAESKTSAPPAIILIHILSGHRALAVPQNTDAAAIAAEAEDYIHTTAAAVSSTDDTAPSNEPQDTAERLLATVIPQGRATITVEEMGKIVGLGRSGAYEAVRRGDVPSRRVNGRIVIPVPALLTWLRSDGASGQKVGPT